MAEEAEEVEAEEVEGREGEEVLEVTELLNECLERVGVKRTMTKAARILNFQSRHHPQPLLAPGGLTDNICKI